MGKIVLAIRHRQLGGGVALDRQLEVGGRHADTIILHHQKIGAAAGNGNSDAGGARIHRILHQLLHRRGRPLDHFTGCNPIHCTFGQTANGHSAAHPSTSSG